MSNRRGLPKKIISDKRTNFVGGKKKLQQLATNQSKLQERDHQIRWHFISPSAPHFGGVHETMVKAAKKYLMQAID